MLEVLEKLSYADFHSIKNKHNDGCKEMTSKEALLSLLMALEDEHWGLSEEFEGEYKIINGALNTIEEITKEKEQ